MKSQSFKIADRFSGYATELREEFQTHFENPKSLNSSHRFVWDHWVVKNQYCFHRTPAAAFFSQKLFQSFQKELLSWARLHLGCFEMTSPWLSYYVEGCEQQVHGDLPHGPWAYVFSLSPPHPKFRGGETFLAKEALLSYWQHFSKFDGLEENQLIQKIPAQFNRLLVFDPRTPHGVTPVAGVRDPLEARVVLHGWFQTPAPYIEGALTSKRKILGSVLNEAFLGCEGILREKSRSLSGICTLRLLVQPSGKISQLNLLNSTLRDLETGKIEKQIQPLLMKHLKKLSFPKARGVSRITLPVVFEFDDKKRHI